MSRSDSNQVGGPANWTYDNNSEINLSGNNAPSADDISAAWTSRSILSLGKPLQIKNLISGMAHLKLQTVEEYAVTGACWF
jgi:hypothetical protein